MSEPLDPPAERWMNALAALLVRWAELDPKGWRRFESVLLSKFRNANCYQLIPWVVSRDEAPILTPEAEMVAPRAVLDALVTRVHDDARGLGSLTTSHRQELHELRRRVIEAAREASDPSAVPWDGDSWNALPPLIRKLLRYMYRREQANLEDVFPPVWDKEYVAAGESAVAQALYKANTFLLQHEWKWTLRKKRTESVIYWD